MRAQVVPETHRLALRSFVRENVEPGATLYTDEAAAYQGSWGYDHEAVKHSVGEYVRGMASTNGVESFWSMLKRAHKGTFHKISPKHLNRYVQEFAGKHNFRESGTLAQMRNTVARAGRPPASLPGSHRVQRGFRRTRGGSGFARIRARASVSGVAPARSRFGSRTGFIPKLY